VRANPPPGAPPKWWGWGEEGKRTPLGPQGLETLSSELGESRPSPRVELGEVELDPAGELPAAIAAVVGDEHVRTDREARIRHAAGRSYPDLLRLRTGALGGAPDAVVEPANAGEVAAVIEACASAGVAVVPFGGGTSVVGGVDPITGPHERLIALDLVRMRDVDIDKTSLTATLGPGLRGPEAEAGLAAHGMTLGHFPQSFEYATIGGFAATRSAGQASCGYGRFDDLVTALALATPIGELRTLATPHTAAGPALRQVALGSEGVLGAITEVTVRVRPVPSSRRYEAWVAADFASACDQVRELAQSDRLPDVVRISDESETRTTLALSGTSGPKRALLDAYLALRRRRGGCIVICGWEGDSESVDRRRALALPVLRRAASLGESPGRAWEHGRYEGPYLRDELMDLGYFVDTLETSHTWSRLDELHASVGTAIERALAAGGTPAIVNCHLSHAYRDGASLYFTFVSRARPGEELEQWREAKSAACEAIVGCGATITHHHAIGVDHAPYMLAEVGAVGIEALSALKERLDPAGIMNPGKLLPEDR
jgi:alkyldihydroxyacetonephosphate synthase